MSVSKFLTTLLLAATLALAGCFPANTSSTPAYTCTADTTFGTRPVSEGLSDEFLQAAAQKLGTSAEAVAAGTLHKVECPVISFEEFDENNNELILGVIGSSQPCITVGSTQGSRAAEGLSSFIVACPQAE